MRASREYTTSRPSAPGGLTGSSLHPSTRLQVGVGGPGSSFSSGGVSGGGSGGGGGAYFPHHGSAGSAYNTPSFSPAASPVASTLSSRPLSATSFKARSSSSSTPVGSAGGSFHFAPTSLSSASGGGASSSLGSVSYSTRGRAPSPSPTSSVARLRDRLASAQIEDMEEYFTGHPSTSSSTHTTASPRSVSTTAFIATPSLFSQPSSHSLSSSSATGTGLSSASNPGSTASRSRLGLGVNTGVSSSSGGGAAAREHRESSSSSHAGSHQIVNAIREQLHAAALNAAGAGVVQASNSQTTLQLPRAVSTSQGTSASSPSASPIPSPSPSDLGSDDDLADMPSPILHNASLAKQARPASAVSAHLGERMGRESPLVKPVAVSSPALASFAPPSASPSVASTTSITTPLSLSSATSFSGDLAPLSAPYVPTSLSHGPAAVATVAAINPNEITIHVCDENRGVTQDFRCDRSLLIAGMKYFRTYLQPQQATQTLYQEEIDISVHCDLFIFQWLLNYITWERQNGLLPGLAPLKEPKNSPARPEKPLLDVNNVVSILISSDFLQMASLVSECIAYMCGSGGVPGSNNNSGELVNILRTPVDLKCLSEELVLRIAREGFLDEEDAFFPVILDSMRNDAGGKLSDEEKSNTQQQHHRRGSSSAADGSKISLPRGLRELLRLNDKRDKIASRLWMVKLENLLDHRSGFLPLDAQGNIFADEESDSLPPGALTTRRKSTLCMCQNCEQKFWKDEFEEELGGGDPYMVQLRALHPHLAPPLPQTALHPSANFCPSLVAHRRVNFHGEITATHRVSEGWNIKKWLLSLRVTHQLNWEQIWWICYGLCHRAPLDCPCAHCGAQSFLYSDIKNCRYHDKEAVWVKRNGSTGGVVHGGSNGHTTGSQLLHPCCGRPSMPFTPWSNGCRSRVHSIQPRTQREKTIYEVAKKFAEAISWSEKEVPATGVETEVTPELAKKKSITFGKDSFSTIGGTTSTTTSASTKDKTSVAAPSILGPALSSTLSSFSSTTDALSKPRSKHPAGSDDESDGGGRKQRRSSASGKAGKSFAALEGNSAEESEEEERRQSQRRRHRRRRSNVASDESGSDDDMDSYDDQDDDDGEGNSSEEGEEEGEEDDEGDDDDGEEDDDEDEDSDGGARRRRAAALTPAQKAQAQAERLKFHKGYQRTNPHGHVPRPSTAAAATGPSHAQRSRSSSSSTRGQNPVVSTNKAKANMSLAEKALQQLRDVLPASEYNALAQTVANSGGAPSIGASQVPASSPTSAAASSSIPAKRAQSAGIRVTTTGKRPATSGGGGGVGQSRKSGPTVAIKSILKPSSGASVTIPSAQPTTSSPTMDEFSSVWGAPPVRAASPETSPVSGSGGSGGGSNVGAFNPYASPTASPDRKKKSGAYDLDSLLEDDRQRMTNLISNLTHSRAATTTATHNPPQATTTAPTTAAQGRGGRLDRASSAQVRKPVAAFK